MTYTKTEVRESPELQNMWNTTNNFNSGRKTNEGMHKHKNLMIQSPEGADSILSPSSNHK
jgi:hypothetical protein